MIEDFKKIEFHDMPIKSISIDFNCCELSLVVKEHDNHLNDYIEIQLFFSKVEDFYFEKVDTVAILDINNFDLEKRGNRYFVEFEMYYNSPLIPFKVSFSFEKVNVIANGIAEW